MWSEWWWDLPWPKKRQRQWKCQIHLGRLLWPMRHLTRLMRRHDLTNKKTKTLREHPQRNTHEIPITFLTLENYNFNIHCHPVCYNLHERMMTAQWYRPIHFLFLRLSLDPNIHGPWSQSKILTGFLYPVFFMLDPQFWSLILILSLLSCPLT